MTKMILHALEARGGPQVQAPRRLVLLLAYNESACIHETVREVRQEVPDADVLVIDDGSRDETAAVARAAGALVARHPINLGVAAAEATGLLYAQRAGYTAVVRMDGDGQHAAGSARALFQALDAGAELAVGSRFLERATFRSTLLRRLGNRYLSLVLTRLCGQRVTDPTSGFRGFGGRAIAYFARVHPHDYPEPESLFMACRGGFRVVEASVEMRPRRTGTSSLTPLRSAFYMLKVTFAHLLERLRPSPAP